MKKYLKYLFLKFRGPKFKVGHKIQYFEKRRSIKLVKLDLDGGYFYSFKKRSNNWYSEHLVSLYAEGRIHE